MFSNVQKGLKFYTPGSTGFIGVQDLVKVMQLLMKSAIINERFVVVSENLSYKQVLIMIADALHKNKPSVRVNKLMSECIWRFEYLRSKITLSEPLLTKRTARSALADHPYTAEKIKKELDYHFETIDSCIAKTAKSMVL